MKFFKYPLIKYMNILIGNLMSVPPCWGDRTTPHVENVMKEMIRGEQTPEHMRRIEGEIRGTQGGI